jgi:NAD+ kinase
MPSRFRHAALIGKFQARGIRGLLEEITYYLEQHGLKVSLERETAQNTGITTHGGLSVAEMGEQCDVAVVVGGDGTMLAIARQLAKVNVPLIGINQGRLGFITDIPVGNFAEALGPILNGDFEEERRAVLEGVVRRKGEVIFENIAMNDVVVSRTATANMIEVKVTNGGEFIANIRSDGLVVASPTGSTAYALSAGGPILHPSLAAWSLVPIAPHDLSNRPIVLPDTGELSIEVVGGRGASVNFDMQSLAKLLHHDCICVRRSQHQVRFLHPRGWSYYATLRRKLHWNAGGE